jgi:hypothetical protein
MTLVGCDLHSRKQQVAVLDTTTGEVLEQELVHEGDAVERFYRALRPPVTIGIETTGQPWHSPLVRPRWPEPCPRCLATRERGRRKKMRHLVVILATAAFIATSGLTPLYAAPPTSDQSVTMDQLPAAAKATVEREAKGGTVARVTQETAKGKTYYEVEIQKDGKDRYVHVAPDGKVLKREAAKKEAREETKEKK